MHKLTITLKQHTPLIHFQHDQDGATLRASEVKPKLDKYILTRLGNDVYQAGIKIAKERGWLVGKGDHLALDYKMRIEAEGEKQEYMIGALISSDTPNNKPKDLIILKSTPYFAQEQENRDIVKTYKIDNEKKSDFREANWRVVPKKGLMWSIVKMSIFANDDLINVIKSKITEFFLCTNFGTRSNKGFGGFTVDKINEIPIQYNDNIIMEGFKTNFEFCYRRNGLTNNLHEVFNSIKNDYQRLKSGVNFNDYNKSLLFCYAVNVLKGNPRWEKRHFKQMMKDKLKDERCLLKANKKNGIYNAPICDSNGKQNWRDYPDKYNYAYIRALLGLAEQFEFQLTGEYEKAVVKVSNKEIERFSSPLFFKVIDKTIYMLGNNSKAILGKSFNFSYKIVKKDKSKRNVIEKELPIGDDSLKTPEIFSIADFVDYAVNKAHNGMRLCYRKIF